MRRFSRLSVLAVAVAVAAATALLGGQVPTLPASASSGKATTTQTPIQHVVIFMKENRSFDEYFGQFPGANGATTGQMSNGKVANLGATPDPMPNDIIHNATSWQVAYNGGKMNGFDKETGAVSSTGQNLAYSQMSQSQIPNYWAYAQRYALGDQFFAAWKGPSFGNNLFAVAAQAGQYDSAAGGVTPYALPESGFQPRLSPWGCDSPPDALVTMLQPSSGALSETYPCLNFPSMPNVLQQRGISWNFFGLPGDTGFAHNALDALSSVRNDPTMWSHVQPIAKFQKDAAAGTLPAVSWIASAQNEHPPASACAGENETVSFMNSLMNGPDWASTAVFEFWDEWGGFYDHVPPPQINAVSYGFRVPLLVISPWTKTGSSSDGGTISSTLYSQASILKFVEVNWGLPAMTPMDAGANDMTDLFDFSAPSKAALILSPRTCTALNASERAVLATRSND